MRTVQKEVPKLLSQQMRMNVNYFHHKFGWDLFQENFRVDNHVYRLYETLLKMWNQWAFPQAMTFTKSDLLERGCTMSNGKYASAMRWLEANGLIKDYIAGSNSGKRQYSSLKMASLEGYYHASKNTHKNATVSSFTEEPEGGMEELLMIPAGDPRYAFAQSIIKGMKVQPEMQPEKTTQKPPKAEAPTPDVAASPKVDTKAMSENEVMDLAQNLAKRAKELYREVHKVNPQIDIQTGLKPEQEMNVSIDIVAYIVQKSGSTDTTEVQTILHEKMGQVIGTEEKTFVAKLIEERFLAHAAAKHGKDKEDVAGVNACFKQGIEVRNECYLLMTEVLMEAFKITRWCEVYHLINKANRVFYNAAIDPKLKADKMNPYAFAKFGKLFDYLSKEKGKKDKRTNFEKS